MIVWGIVVGCVILLVAVVLVKRRKPEQKESPKYASLREAWIDFKVSNSKSDGGPAILSGKDRAKRKAKRKMANASRRKNRG